MAPRPIRILQIVSSLSAGNGALSVVLNWHRHIDPAKVQFDYLYFIQTPVTKEAEITRLGGRVYYVPYPSRNLLGFLCETYRFFKNHWYHTIHSHVTAPNFIFYPLARLFGTKNIVQHAHLNKWGETKRSALRNYLMLHAVWPLINYKMACSQAAGKVYFGKDFTVVNNGIDVDKFAYNPTVRGAKRNELQVENNFVIGHVGRFSAQKNHRFLLEIFEEVLSRKPSAKLMLVGGTGPLEKEIRKRVAEKHLQDHVLFLGMREDIADLCQAFDVFVFPSLYEGLGIVAIEAQAAGLLCVLADTLPPEAFVCNYKKLPLGNAQEWARAILPLEESFNRQNTAGKVVQAGFSAGEIAQRMQTFYQGIEASR